uniref:Isopiperitenone reductase n=1 Tax=Mentha canadensis TaxID=294733 RepID=A0A7S9XVT0_9LAMI|nr:isopiperitenone reductase [Mentha canadensis]
MANVQRYALVTGANKGIGFEICRQLAEKGIIVILTARNEKRGIEAHQRLLKELNISKNHLVFHQLDVTDPASIAAVAVFIKSTFGKLDILVNNAGVSGVEMVGDVSVFNEYIEADFNALQALEAGAKEEPPFKPKANGEMIEKFEGAKDCVETNYYGPKRLTQALIPLLQLSPSPRIVNVSSSFGSLLLLWNEWAKGVLGDEDRLTEERVDEVVEVFLKDIKDGKLEENQWPPHFAAERVSKAALNAYTKIAAKKYPSFRINAICPGYAKTDITFHAGPLSVSEAAQVPVKLALLPDGGPSGCFLPRDKALALY